MLTDAWTSMSDNYVFWVCVVILHAIMLIFNPSKLPIMYIASAILYILTGVFSEWHNLFYGFYAYFLWSWLILPINGIPLIFIAIGGFLAGKWLASL